MGSQLTKEAMVAGEDAVLARLPEALAKRLRGNAAST